MPRVTTKGQVTIPNDIRERLGVEPGDETMPEQMRRLRGECPRSTRKDSSDDTDTEAAA